MGKVRKIAIFTTASLPWMTGTAVNPLFRAAYLAKGTDMKVTLVVPWLSLKDQGLIYPNGITFISPSEQRIHVLNWLNERIGFSSDFNLQFYPGTFSRDKRSILPVGDITSCIPDEEADIAVLEEPEHLTWYHHGERWNLKFQRVVGVVHTNYVEYVKREKNGWVNSFFLGHINSWVIGIYCHKVIRLSGAVQDLPRSVICNVHGVNPKFLEIGRRRPVGWDPEDVSSGRAYYIGKMVWSKGYRELLSLVSRNQHSLSFLRIDLFGTGEDSDNVRRSASLLDVPVNVYSGLDHADPSFHKYKVLLNASTSDVVCTTTAEALAMGKFVVCADHPSNDFFRKFPNCLTYRDATEFVSVTLRAIGTEPVPLTDDQRHQLSWEDSTDRFVAAADLDRADVKPETPVRRFASLSIGLKKRMDDASAFVHYAALGFETSRRAFGAVPDTLKPSHDQCRELGINPVL